VADTTQHDAQEDEPDWYPDVTDDSLRPRYTASGIEYYVQPDRIIFLSSVTLPDE